MARSHITYHISPEHIARTNVIYRFPRLTAFCTGEPGLSPVYIQTHAMQALALRALRKRKPQATQALDWLLR